MRGYTDIRFFFSGSSYSFGVIQAALVREGLAPPSTLAFVGSLAVACLSVFAIPNSKLIRKYGGKNVLLVGAIVKGLGEISASFAVKNVAALFVTYGVVTGVGYSMIYLVSPSSVALGSADTSSQRLFCQINTLSGRRVWQTE